MINAKELRLGNLFEYKITDKFDDRKEWWEVSKIDADDIHWLSKVDSNDEDFRPIPLTEEWLLKFGFDRVYDGNYKRYQINLLKTIIYLRPSLDKWFFGFVNNGQDFEINDCYELEFVHEIQNLIFSLTRKELVVSDAVS